MYFAHADCDRGLHPLRAVTRADYRGFFKTLWLNAEC